jgi:hypothetical protein
MEENLEHLWHRLLEGELDLEAQPIDADDLDGAQRGIC